MHAPGVGVAAVLVDGQEFVLVLRSRRPAKGLWAFPGGRVELGEGIREAARREILEECGLEVRIGQLIDVIEALEEHDDETTHWVLPIFLARVESGELRAGDDALDARWTRLDELDALPAAPRVRELARQALTIAGIKDRA